MNIHPVEGGLFHADRQTGRQDETNICFSQFSKSALKRTHLFLSLCGLKQYKTLYEVQVKTKWIFSFGGRIRFYRKRPQVAACGGGKIRLDWINIWVRVFMVPMHLGLINRPFVPHNLKSAQGSPVPC